MNEPGCETRIVCSIDTGSDCVHVLQAIAELMAVRAGVSALHANRVALAVDELFANIMRHGYAGGPGRVEMEATLGLDAEGRRCLCFMFRDYAPCIEDVGSLMTPTPTAVDEMRPGGLGLCLIHAVMDEVHHRAAEDGNHWRLVVHV